MPDHSEIAAARRSLEAHLGIRFEAALDHGRLEELELKDYNDLARVRSLCLAGIESGAWRIRNEAVKLLGLALHPDAGELLPAILRDRSPAPLLHRMLGGDYFHCGFERRNAVSSMALLGSWNDSTTELAIRCLRDPYYEVLSACCRWIETALTGRCICEGGAGVIRSSDDLVGSVTALTGHGRIEVRCAAWRAAGAIAPAETVLAMAEGVLADPRVMVREALLDSFGLLLDRYGALEVREEMESCLNRLLLTSVAMRPNYPVRERYRYIRQRLEDGSCST